MASQHMLAEHLRGSINLLAVHIEIHLLKAAYQILMFYKK